MLVDVKRDKNLAFAPDEMELRQLLKEMGEFKLFRITQGFYITGPNPHMMLKDSIKNEFPYESLPSNIRGYMYGVCDDPWQFIERFGKTLESLPNKYFVTFTKIEKRKQPKSGGWRWHKWGIYIGDKNPKHEYIKDEDDSIKIVYCYHIREAV